MDDLTDLSKLIDGAIIKSRLNMFGVMMMVDPAARQAAIANTLAALPSGAYLIGTGPSTVGIVPLTVDEVVIGRSATPVEEPAEAVTDYQVADAVYLGPYEVSRTHAKVVRRSKPSEPPSYWLVDLSSRCGTFVNGQVVSAQGCGTRLSQGDHVSLGGSHVSTYVFVCK